MSIRSNLPNNPNVEIIKANESGIFTNYIFKAIPVAFDESMSYYETLCGLLYYLKDVVIPTVNNNADAVSELQNLYEELKTYVDDYFKNLDVQEEINNKLDNMVLNGIFDEYFNGIIQEVNNIKNNYRNKAIPIGMGDLSQEVKEALTGGSTPVVGVNSVNTENIVDKAVTYKKVSNNILLSQDLTYLASTYGGKNFIYDIKQLNTYIDTSNGYNSQGINTELTTRTYFQPNGTLKLIPLNFKNKRYVIYKYTLSSKPENTIIFSENDYEAGSIDSNTGIIGGNYTVIRSKNFIEVENDTRYYVDPHCFKMWIYIYNKEDETYIERKEINDYTLTNEYKYKIVLSYNINAGLYFNNNQSLINELIQDINSIFLNYVDNTPYLTNEYTLINIPQYVYRIRLQNQNGSLPLSSTDYNNYLLYVDGVNTLNENIINKKFSVIGDSFSAYNGYIPSGNNAYYYGNNAGVTSVNDMWWEHLVNDYGATRVLIQASSSTSVSNINATEKLVPMSDISRCQNLSDNDIIPEIVIIMGGTNDFSHANPNIGTYNGIGSFPTTNDNFRNAYALMLQRIRQKYPNTDIFCCSLPLFVRLPENKYVPQQNGEPKTTLDYNNAIKEISSLMNCQYIDLNECGFNPVTYYPTYCEDNENRPTHPNAKGQKVIADVIANNIIKFYSTNKK